MKYFYAALFLIGFLTTIATPFAPYIYEHQTRKQKVYFWVLIGVGLIVMAIATLGILSLR